MVGRTASARTGWTRHRGGGPARSFTAHGHEVLERGPDTRPTLARRVSYPVGRLTDGALGVTETPGTRHFRYLYDGPDDLVGRAVPLVE